MSQGHEQMAKDSQKTDQRLDELYRDHPEGFTAGRNELAKDLRASGDRDEAERVKRLRRPSAAAWLVNRVAIDSPETMDAFGEASEELEKAQSRAVEGKQGAATELRAAAARERDAVAAVLEEAERSARGVGHPPNARTLELVADTLRAASGDGEFRKRVRAGRLERERTAATLGTVPDKVPFRRRVGSEKRREVAQAQRELKRLEQELERVAATEERLQDQIERTSEALRSERRQLAEAKRESNRLRRELKATERRAGK
jgi:hypothetical protein